MANAFSELYQGIAGAPSGVKSIINTAKTQYYNASGQLVPGYNTTAAQVAAANAPQPTTPTPAQTAVSTPAAQSGAYNEDDAAAATDKANTLFSIDNGLTSANGALARLDGQAATGGNNIDQQYDAAYNELLGKRAQTDATYNTNKVADLNSYEAARNASAAGARTFLDSARRTLGANGAGGGSAARYGITQDAAERAMTGNNAAQATNNKNIIALDTEHNQNNDDYTNSASDLLRQKIQGHQDLESKIEQSRADLLGTVATLTGQKTIANGGNVQQANAAVAPITSRISGILDKIDGLAATPAIAAKQVTVGAPSLAGYNFAQPTAETATPQDASLTDPLIAALLGTGTEDQRRQLAYA